MCGHFEIIYTLLPSEKTVNQSVVRKVKKRQKPPWVATAGESVVSGTEAEEAPINIGL